MKTVLKARPRLGGAIQTLIYAPVSAPSSGVAQSHTEANGVQSPPGRQVIHQNFTSAWPRWLNG